MSETSKRVLATIPTGLTCRDWAEDACVLAREVEELEAERDELRAKLAEAEAELDAVGAEFRAPAFGPQRGELATFVRETLRVDEEHIAHLSKRITELTAERDEALALAEERWNYARERWNYAREQGARFSVEVGELHTRVAELRAKLTAAAESHAACERELRAVAGLKLKGGG